MSFKVKIMPVSRVYLDHNASTPLMEAAHREMSAVMQMTGNPSSVHGEGRALQNVIEKARSLVAEMAGAKRSETVFTGSATEAITQAIVGGQRHFKFDRIILSAGEHMAVKSAAEMCDCSVETIGLNAEGYIDLSMLGLLLSQADVANEKVLVALHTVNGETGVIQPVDDIIDLVGPSTHMLFLDAVQALGKLNLDFSNRPIDMMAVSAHKIGGPAGIGALFVKEHCNEVRLIPGGGQELGRRGGTQSSILIAGFGGACSDVPHKFDRRFLSDLISRFEAGLRSFKPDAVIFGKYSNRIGTVSNFALPGISRETVLIGLDLKDISVSAGSACSSGKTSISPVLVSMGVEKSIAECALRLSVGWTSTNDDIDRAIDAIAKICTRFEENNEPIVTLNG